MPSGDKNRPLWCRWPEPLLQHRRDDLQEPQLLRPLLAAIDSALALQVERRFNAAEEAIRVSGYQATFDVTGRTSGQHPSRGASARPSP
jgi:hypothetical protein